MMTKATTPASQIFRYQQPNMGRVLVVDDDPEMRELLTVYLEESGFTAKAVSSIAGLSDAIDQTSFDAVLLDLFLENEDGLEALPILARKSPYTKVIMMSAYGTIELAVNAMEKGASSFVSKSKDPRDLIEELKRRLNDNDHYNSGNGADLQYGIVGKSSAIKDVLKRIEQFKDVDSTILISGESGTGKEVVARAIHQVSRRFGERFAAINCGAIPENLLESELFGHKRGAFTDAKADRKGLFESSAGGTVFLDEIGEMPLHLQVKLLRVLQEREVTPIGSSTPVKVSCRVVAATNRHLPEEVKKGAFREDLYFRLAVLRIDVPPLRKRREDIPMLVDHFIQVYSERFDKRVQPITKELEFRLVNYEWPGNVRELQNAIERAVVLSNNGELALENLIQPYELDDERRYGNSGGGLTQDGYMDRPLSEAKQSFEKEYLRHLLEATRGNISEMARISGRYRADIYRLLTKHGVEWDEFRQQ